MNDVLKAQEALDLAIYDLLDNLKAPKDEFYALWKPLPQLQRTYKSSLVQAALAASTEEEAAEHRFMEENVSGQIIGLLMYVNKYRAQRGLDIP